MTLPHNAIAMPGMNLIVGGAIVDRPKPKDRTGAERQRRRRAKQRDNRQRDADRDSGRDSVTEQEPLQLVAAE
jgi:hypothetical protein